MPVVPSHRTSGTADLGPGSGGRIGPFRVLGRLGAGGMGTVFLAEPVEPGPVPRGIKVAVKVLRSTDPQERRRFAREARYLMSLHHPGIVRILDSGEEDGRCWLAMPLIAGRRFDHIVRSQGPLPERQAADLMVQAAEAVHAAHLAGILHRDIKPGNLMLDDQGRVKALDFGLAAADAESQLTQEGDVVGTPAYMPPEQAAGLRSELTRRSDVYSLGAVLYELLTGLAPFDGATPVGILRAVLDQPLVPPSRLRPGIHRGLERIVLVAMAKGPKDRYRSAEAMAADLRAFLDGQSITATPPSAFVLAVRQAWLHRRQWMTYGLVLFVAFSLTLIGGIRLARSLRPAVVAPLDHPSWIQAFPGNQPTTKAATWQSHAPLGQGAEIFALPRVTGAVRLEATATLPKLGAFAALLVLDRDVAAGYQLRLERVAGPDDQHDAAELSLWREGTVMIRRTLAKLPATPIQLNIQVDDGTLTGGARWAGGPENGYQLEFQDLAPISSPGADGVWLARRDGAQISDAHLHRQRSGEFVSALALADENRVNHRYSRALELYEGFLRDHPDSPQAMDAKLRIGLCQEGLEDHGAALETFKRIASESRLQPRYVLVATFHCWINAFRLGRSAESGRYLAALRSTYDLNQIAATIPETLRREVLDDHAKRAEAIPVSAPAASQREAAFLLLTAAELATQLEDQGTANRHNAAAGLRFLIADDREISRQTWLRLLSESSSRDPAVGEANLGLGHAARLDGDLPAAVSAYQKALKQVDPSRRATAALWLGDALAEQGAVTAADAIWSANSDRTPQGRLLKRLVQRFATGLEVDSPESAWTAWRIAALQNHAARVEPPPRAALAKQFPGSVAGLLAASEPLDVPYHPGELDQPMTDPSFLGEDAPPITAPMQGP
jgi:serine/threonine protein kinase/TolA-binding protein